MTLALRQVVLARHGETAWSTTGRHTGLTDVPLTPMGEGDATALGRRLAGRNFARVLVSPLVRARRTCDLAGFGVVAEVVPDLVEWDYGAYEGLTGDEIRKTRPGWRIFRDGVIEGETLERVAARADRVVARLRESEGDALVFAHGHYLRILAARWLGRPPEDARHLYLSTASMSVLGFDRSPDDPVIRLWNDDAHAAR
jgi:broad specificity phosphatase PhoE